MSDEAVVAACNEAWTVSWLVNTPNRDNCSGFVKSVLASLKITGVPDTNADGLCDYFAASWQLVSDGVNACKAAAEGSLVVGTLSSTEHTPPRHNGHVVVVVDGELYRHKYPRCWCGSIGSAQSKGTKSVGEVWGQKDRDNVKYYSCPLTRSPTPTPGAPTE